MRTLLAAMISAFMLFAPPTAAQKAAQTPTQFYMQYRDAWQKAKSIDELMPYLGQESRAEIDATPKEKRAMMFQMMKMMGNMTNVKVVKETRQGDGYLLDMTAMGPDKAPMKGTAEIVMEGGAMKLKKESWSS